MGAEAGAMEMVAWGEAAGAGVGAVATVAAVAAVMEEVGMVVEGVVEASAAEVVASTGTECRTR